MKDRNRIPRRKNKKAVAGWLRRRGLCLANPHLQLGETDYNRIVFMNKSDLSNNAVLQMDKTQPPLKPREIREWDAKTGKDTYHYLPPSTYEKNFMIINRNAELIFPVKFRSGTTHDARLIKAPTSTFGYWMHQTIGTYTFELDKDITMFTLANSTHIAKMSNLRKENRNV